MLVLQRLLVVLLCSLVGAQVHLHPVADAPQQHATRPSAPQVFNPATLLGSGTARGMRIPLPFIAMGAKGGFDKIPPSMLWTSPYDYEADDAANVVNTKTPDTWFERIDKTKDTHKRAYDSITHGVAPRMGWMGTGVHRPINPLVEAQELSDIDPWRQMATQWYAMFRSPARNPEIRGETLRRLQKSEVTGFDHTNGQYGLPLGTGLRGIGSGIYGLTKFDYGPFGLGPLHPNPLAYAAASASQGMTNQMAAPFGITAALGFTPPILPFS